MKKDAAAIARNPRVAFHPMAEGQGGVLLHLDSGAYHGINDVGLLVWQLLEEEKTPDQLISLVAARVTDAPATLAQEIGGFIDELSHRDLVIRAVGSPQL